MTFYSNLAGTAQRLLAKYGQTVVLRRVTPGAYSTATSQAAVPTADTNFKGALFDFKDGVTKAGETLVEAGDKQLLIEAAAAPKVDDIVVIGGVEWQVVGIPQEINPAGTTVIYMAHVRK